MTIQQYLNEGRLIRGQWAREQDGRQLLCLYTALVGDPAARPGTCPASVAPRWLAELLPWIDDAGTQGHWPEVVRRVAAQAPRYGELAGDRSTRLEYRVRALCVREAMRHTQHGETLAACERVASLCQAVADGAPIDAAAFRAAEQEAAWAATAEAAVRAADAARADRLIDAILDAIDRELSQCPR